VAGGSDVLCWDLAHGVVDQLGAAAAAAGVRAPVTALSPASADAAVA